MQMQESNIMKDDNFSCQICHEYSLPLVKVCQCLGSVSFVHRQCIKKWIGYLYRDKKIQNHPSCELCSSPLSALIVYNKPKIQNILLIYHMFNLSSKEKILSLLLIHFIVAMIILDLKIIVVLVDIFVYQDWKINIFYFGTKNFVVTTTKVLLPVYLY